MLSKAKIKFLQSLAQKKNRAAAGAFVAEGTKIVDELLASRFQVLEIFALERWLTGRTLDSKIEVHAIDERDLGRISELTTPHEALAVVAIPRHTFDAAALRNQLTLALEDVQDPGNLGAIVRLCDWFGIDDILASGRTVDCFNPKVVQATMGSIARVRLHYRDDFMGTIAECRRAGKPIVAAMMDGEDIYRTPLPAGALVLLGNEGSGLSGDVQALCDLRIRIPRFKTPAAESLNVASAAAIICSEFKRRSNPNM